MKLSLATRIFLGYAAVLVTFGAVSLFSVAEMHQNQEEIRLVSQGYLHLSQEAAAIETFHKNESRDLARVLDEKNPETRRALIRLAKLYFPPLIAQRLASARQKTNDMLAVAPASEHLFLHELAARLTEMDARQKATDAAIDNLLAELTQAKPDAQQVARRRAELEAATSSLEGDVRYLHGALESRIRERVQLAEQRERRTGVAIIALSVVAIAVGLIATFLSARSLRPVRTLTSFVSRIASGDYSAEVSVKGDDEIATLAREFDKMARSLREREAQLKEKQQALLRAEQLAAVGRVSAQIAHEVRNPLSSIGLNVELIDEAFAKARFPSEADAREAHEVLASVLREVDRVTEITESYLKMARLPQPALASEDVNRVVANVLEFSREELERARVQVVRELEDGLPNTLADEGQLRQVFLNLVRNSREAMAEGGTLTVRTRVLGDEVEVRFRDSGEGIAKDVQGQIFEPFFSTKKGGTGLGLAVSRQIVQAHGGSIACEGLEGGGTTFVIRLPKAP